MIVSLLFKVTEIHCCVFLQRTFSFCPITYSRELCTWFRFMSVIHLILKQITEMLMEGCLRSLISSLSTEHSYAFWISYYAATQANPVHLNINMSIKNKIKGESWLKKKHKTQPCNYTHIISLRVWVQTYFKNRTYNSYYIFVIRLWSSF